MYDLENLRVAKKAFGKKRKAGFCIYTCKFNSLLAQTIEYWNNYPLPKDVAKAKTSFLTTVAC